MTNRKFIVVLLVLILEFGFLAQAIGARSICGEQPCCDQRLTSCYCVSEDTMISLSKKCCDQPQQNPCNLETDQFSTVHHYALSSSRKIIHDHSVVIQATIIIPILFKSSESFDTNLQIGVQVRKQPLYLANLSLIC